MTEQAYYVGQVAELTATFTVDGTPTDPTTVVFSAQKPDGTLIEDIDPENAAGAGEWAAEVPVDQVGLWHYRFIGSGAAVAALPGAFYALSSVFDDTELLVSREYAKFALQITDDDDDISLDLALHEASDAVRTYTRRTFEAVSASAVAREFDFGEGGITVVDDFQHGSITAVALDNNNLGDSEWTASPRSTEFPVAYWLETGTAYRPESPEMGFAQNVDVLVRDGVLGLGTAAPLGQKLAITARWGWPRVPRDVQRATIWTAAALRERPSAYISESIAGYSRTQANPLVEAIPRRAQGLLDPFVREG